MSAGALPHAPSAPAAAPIASGARVAAHRRLVLHQTAIGVAGNALLAAIVVSVLFRGRDEIAVLGEDGAAHGIIVGTFMFALGMTIGLTTTIRRRVRGGIVPRLARARAGPGGWLPRQLVVRAVLVAALVELALVPATFMLLGWFAPPSWSATGAVAFNVGYFVLMSGTVVPIVAWRALAD